ncbi:amino acid permease [Escherichia coli]
MVPGYTGLDLSALFLGVIFLLNYISIRGFGEAEYWFSLIKVTTVIVFIIVGVLMIIGIFKGAQPAGWSNWTIGEAPFAGGFAAMIGVAMIVGFSFQGTELIGIAAGESEDPAKNIPRAVRQVFWRILLFYVFAILIISLIIPYTDPSLLRNDVKDISASPFTLVFQHAGLLSAAAVMNAVILTAVLSAGNSGMYASTRMLYTLACDGKAPRIFAKLSRGGVPRNALYATTVIAGLCFLTSMFGNQTVYLWLLNTSGMTGFIAWLGIAISHYRFRRGYVLQGHDINDLPYRSRFLPTGANLSHSFCVWFSLWARTTKPFLKDTIDWGGVAATYIGIPLFLIIWFGYKLIKGTHFVRYSEIEVARRTIRNKFPPFLAKPSQPRGLFNSISLTNHADIKFNIWIIIVIVCIIVTPQSKKADKSEAVPAFWDDHLHTNKSTAMLPYARGREEDVSDNPFYFRSYLMEIWNV